MAPLTSTPTPTTMANLAPTLKPEKQSFSGDEFSNNLFSDLAPLLTLFGEQVTKQFLSMSMGWADNILIAMGPLGILTTVVSAIRVGGVKNLKSLVGRARESLAIAEQELLSSTSDDVCEMWSGTDIVRQLGKPKTMELVFVQDENTSVPKVIGLTKAIEGSYMHHSKGSSFSSSPEELASQAPNIALNSKGSLTPKKELWFWAIVGIILQLAAIIFPALMTYLWDFTKAGSNIQGYAYPCFASGTLAIVFGVTVCSHVIEGVTSEELFEPKTGKVLSVLRLQRACTVSDQSFQPFLIMNPHNNKQIRTSRLLEWPDPLLRTFTSLATLLTVLGFIFQFVGLRGLHWSATIFQLGVTLVMTGARSWVRRGLSTDLPCKKLIPGYELEMTALFLAAHPLGVPIDLKNHTIAWNIKIGWISIDDVLSQRSLLAEVESHLPNFLETALFIQKDLAQLMPDMTDTPDRGEVSKAASELVASMTKILGCYEKAIQGRWIQLKSRNLDQKRFEWSHHASYFKDHKWKHETVSCWWEKAPLETNKENQSRLELIIRFCACPRWDFLRKLRLSAAAVVVGHGDSHKRDELEDWLGAEQIYNLGIELPHQRRPALFGVSTLPLPIKFVPGLEYFAIQLQTRNLPQLWALELFSGFMNSLAESVKVVGGSTKFVKRRSSQDHSASVKENSVLLSFSQVLVDCGLVETIEDANAYVIPPFANRGLLPTKCGDLTFDEPVEEPSNRSSPQSSSVSPVESARRDPIGQSKQVSVSGTNKKPAEDRERTESQLKSARNDEAVTDRIKQINDYQEELSEDGPVAHSLHPGFSAPEGEDDSKGEKQKK